MAKPHKGRIANWVKFTVDPSYGLGYVIIGDWLDDPRPIKPTTPTGRGMELMTSYVVAHDEATGEIETRNSRYTLVGGKCAYVEDTD